MGVCRAAKAVASVFLFPCLSRTWRQKKDVSRTKIPRAEIDLLKVDIRGYPQGEVADVCWDSVVVPRVCAAVSLCRCVAVSLCHCVTVSPPMPRMQKPLDHRCHSQRISRKYYPLYR
ncbi:hypothetical protein B0H67DRAFT_138230 [Lasiosphaeris hirsuta]|uniref:Uncharacterized protein n=1 Tax=Lasiosphaeris hirsuta TaxID=260670 RepID=A0AA40E5F7_9PEZI|nr:hypothetical protein B0H67DRAFT_138230 [Lasiosphaeris hirsuta]